MNIYSQIRPKPPIENKLDTIIYKSDKDLFLNEKKYFSKDNLSQYEIIEYKGSTKSQNPGAFGKSKHQKEHSSDSSDQENKDQLKEQESVANENHSAEELLRRRSIQGLLEDLINMFPDRERTFPELIQNSLDSGTQKIDVRFEYDEETEMATYEIEDYGCGMTNAERDDFFLKLFNSSKEQDISKRGKFGIGVVSSFLIEPLEMIVESTKGNEKWKGRIFEIPQRNFKLEISKETKKEKGTKISLRKKISAQDFGWEKEKATRKIKEFCRYAPIPIFVDGKKITIPYEIKADFSIPFSYQDAEGFVALSRSPQYYISSGRLKLEEGTHFSDKNPLLTVLVDSKRLSCNLTRNAIEQDAYYERLKSFIEHQGERLFTQAVLALEDLVGKDKLDDEESKKIRAYEELISDIIESKTKEANSYNYRLDDSAIKRFFKCKRERTLDDYLSPEVRKAKIFRTIDGKIVSIDDARSKKTRVASKRTRAVDKHLEKGYIVLPEEYSRRSADNLSKVIRHAYDLHPTNIATKYSLNKEVSREKLGEEHQKFLSLFEEFVRGSPISSRVLGLQYSDRSGSDFYAKAKLHFLEKSENLSLRQRLNLSFCSFAALEKVPYSEIEIGIDSSGFRNILECAKQHDFLDEQDYTARNIAYQRLLKECCTTMKLSKKEERLIWK